MRQGKEVELPQKLICRTKSIFDGWIVCVKDLSYLYDALTGVYTRTALSEEINRLEQEMRDAKSAAKEKMMIDVIFIDVDGLKRVNDNGGHSEGDKLLRGIADIIKASVRGRDIIGRYGGDEFVVVIPRTQSGVRERVVAQIRRETKLIGASVSIGAVTINATSAIIEDAIEAADNQMYEEKKAKDGRVL
jgi:diguanylate cyclase (GGDEF)-like protein